jgi:hypothetical protein
MVLVLVLVSGGEPELSLLEPSKLGSPVVPSSGPVEEVEFTSVDSPQVVPPSSEAL